ncbi:MAG: hypothetical protein WHT08_16175 [Bryobacteraceae bacterium]
MNRIAGVLRLMLAAAALLAAASIVQFALRRREKPPPPPPRKVSLPPELAGSEVRILAFYAASVPERGRPFRLCYSVLNAAHVRLDPPLAEISPSLSRCVEAVIHRRTTVTLTATGKAGQSASVSIELPVREPQPEILFVNISSREIRRGDRFTLCYGVRDATRVRVEPGSMELPVSANRCASGSPRRRPRG